MDNIIDQLRAQAQRDEAERKELEQEVASLRQELASKEQEVCELLYDFREKSWNLSTSNSHLNQLILDKEREARELRQVVTYLAPTAQELQRENEELQQENLHLKNCAAWTEIGTNKALKRIRELEVENLSMDWVLMPNEPVEESPKTSVDNDAIIPPAPRKRTRTARMRTGGLNAQTLRRINAQTQDE